MSDRNTGFLSRTKESRVIDVCYVFKTRVQNSITVTHLISPCQYKGPGQYTLHVSKDPTATSRDIVGIDIELSSKAKQALLE